jgi:hypothetical protein
MMHFGLSLSWPKDQLAEQVVPPDRPENRLSGELSVMKGGKMKRFFLILVTMVLLLPVATVQSAEPVPFKEFVSITEKVFDALDEVEVVFSNPESMEIEVNMAFKKIDIEMLKYRRYVQDWRKSPGKQADIIRAIATADIKYRITRTKIKLKEEDLYGESHKDAKLASQEAREIFVKYKKLKK